MALSLSGMTYGGSAADKVLRMIFPPKTIARLSSVTKGLIMFGTAAYRDMSYPGCFYVMYIGMRIPKSVFRGMYSEVTSEKF